MDTPFPQTAVQAFEKIREAQSEGGKQNAKKVKDWTQKALNATTQLISVLETFSSANPVSQAVVDTFKKLITMEQGRRDNNEQIIVVYDSMTRVFATLKTFNDSVKMHAGFSEPFEAVLNDLNNVMKEFGTFAGLFYTKFDHRIVRFFKAEEFAKKLHGFARSFERHREQILFMISAQTSADVQALQRDVQSVLAYSEKIFARLQPSSPADLDARRFVARIGGAGVVIKDRATLEEVARLLAGGSSNVEPITANTMEALRAPLEELLEKHRAWFETKLDRVQGVIVGSITGIMKQLTSGPHELIIDPDIQKIWKDAGWRLSVKVRVFVDAVYSHFDEKFRAETAGDVEDAWTLVILSKVMHHPAIGEAIDEDATGFLSVQEVNRFLSKKPTKWTTPQWLVFWALGWHCMNSLCTDSVEYLLEQLEELCESLTHKGSETIKRSVAQFYATTDMLQIVANWDEDGDVGTEQLLADYDDLTSMRVMDLSSELDAVMQEQVVEVMTGMDFCIEDPSDLEYLARKLGWRIEQFFVPLLYVILNHYCEYISDINRSCDSDDNDTTIDNIAAALDTLDTTLRELLYAFDIRMRSLCRSWRSQRLDDELQVQCYAGGLMYSWYTKVQDSRKDVEEFFFGSEEDDGETGGEDGGAGSDDKDDSVSRNVSVGVRQMHKKVNGLTKELKEVKAMMQQLLQAMQLGGVQQQHGQSELPTPGGIVDVPTVLPLGETPGGGYLADGSGPYASAGYEGPEDAIDHGPAVGWEGDANDPYLRQEGWSGHDSDRNSSPRGTEGSDDGEDGDYE